MNEIDKKIKKGIMRRVYFIWMIKRIASPLVIKIAALIVFMWRTSFYVSGIDIANNARVSAASFGSTVGFLSSAVANTEVFTLIFLSLIAVLAIWIVKDVFEKTESSLSFSS
jgi:magnesium-transporting ATPase (P-type)